MPIQSTIHRKNSYVQTTCTGAITLSEVLEYQQDIWANGNIPGFSEIFDALQADFSAFSMSDIFKACQHSIQIDKSTTSSRLAFVLSTEAQQQMADFYRSVREMNTSNSRVVQLFDTLDDAFNWIHETH